MIGAASSTTALMARRTILVPDFLADVVFFLATFTNARAVFLAVFTVYVFFADFLADIFLLVDFFGKLFALVCLITFFTFLAICLPLDAAEPS